MLFYTILLIENVKRFQNLASLYLRIAFKSSGQFFSICELLLLLLTSRIIKRGCIVISKFLYIEYW